MLKHLTYSLLSLFIYSHIAVASTAETKSKPIQINNLQQSVYELLAINKDKQSIEATGSAVAISKHYLATNCHVALAANYLVADIQNNPYLAKLCYYNRDEDLCIIEVSGIELYPARIRPSKYAKSNDTIYVISYPKGVRTITTGNIIRFVVNKGKLLIETTSSMTFGSSGGGIFDSEGYLIGIATGGIPEKGLGYAIPSERILDVINPKNLPSCQIPPELSDADNQRGNRNTMNTNLKSRNDPILNHSFEPLS